MGDFEDIILAFVEAKIPKSKWSSLISRYDILQKIEDDDEEEIKDRLWQLLLNRINWASVLNEIMVQAQDLEESEDEEEDADSEEDSD
jgi:hypothetical protein